MNIALMHFHLKTRGVATVIRRQIVCLNVWAELFCDILHVDNALPAKNSSYLKFLRYLIKWNLYAF